jgi:hypothetical protein
MTAEIDERAAGLTAAQALTALNVFSVRLLQRHGLSLAEMEAALDSDPAVARSIRTSLASDPTQTADLARTALSDIFVSDSDALAELADACVADAEDAATLQGPLTLLIGGGVAIGLLFVLLLDRVGPDGLVMRKRMPEGLVQVLEQAGALVERVAKLIGAGETPPAKKD